MIITKQVFFATCAFATAHEFCAISVKIFAALPFFKLCERNTSGWGGIQHERFLLRKKVRKVAFATMGMVYQRL